MHHFQHILLNTMKTKLRISITLLTSALISCDPNDDEALTSITTYPSVTVSTVAGQYLESGTGGFSDGKGQAARFSYPGQLAIDKYDNLYIIDQGLFSEDATVIRKMDSEGNVITFASGFGSISDICIDPRDGVTLYAVDNSWSYPFNNNAIYKINSNGDINLIAGGPDRIGYKDGTLEEAMFKRPSGCVMDHEGNLYIADAYNHCIRKIDLDAGSVTTLAGHPFDIYTTTCRYADGKGMAAEFCNFIDLTIDAEGNLMVPDYFNHRVRKVTPDGEVSTIIASGGSLELDGPLSEATASYPLLTVYDDFSKHLFMSSHSGGKLRVATHNGLVFSLAGLSGNSFGHGYQDGDGKEAKFNGIRGLAVNSNGEIFISDNVNHCIRKVVLQWH